MTTTPQFVSEPGNDSLADKARDHLWMHFTRHSTYYDGGHVPIIVKGEGAYIWDDQGKRYFDGLSGLFVVQAGHGRKELAEAAAKQASVKQAVAEPVETAPEAVEEEVAATVVKPKVKPPSRLS